MQLPDAITLVNRMIETGETHQDYKRVIELAETYRIYITGCDIDKKLIQFVQREEKSLFEQRVALTRSVTPAVASSIRQPFNKVVRNERIRKDIKIAGEGRKQIVEKMIAGFFGSARKKNRGLNYWMKTRFIELEFIDPNSWVVVEWDAPESSSTPIRPRPFEVSAEEAVNFFVVNDEIKWLFVRQKIKVPSLGSTTGSGSGYVAGANNAPGAIQPITPKPQKKDGYRYTLYDEELTLVLEQVDPEYMKSTGYVMKEGETLVVLNDIHYLSRSFTPNVGYAPVFRVGYKRDEATKGRTFVNPWHDALCFFDKSLKTVSELDLTMTLHTFPQKLQYVQKCKGPTKTQRCNMGNLPDGSSCTVCGGTGYKVHTTAQDAMLLPMPDSKDDMLDLEKLLVYKAPPIELIKFQNEYTQQLERQAHQAVFNSQVFVKKAGQPGASGQPIQTATEADYNMQSVYDALEPFTEKYSEIYRDFVTTFGVLAGESLDNVDVVHDFPSDPKLKNGDILMGERKMATDSGAPMFLIETIDDDLATIVYNGDPLAMQRYRVKRRFYPFMGYTPDEIASLLTSEHVPRAPKVLYSNFDSIFKEIEEAKPTFWSMTSVADQRKIVDEKVQEYITKLDAEKPKITVDSLREGNPLDGAGGDGNPGSDDTGENTLPNEGAED
jgi:hypothetical protein